MSRIVLLILLVIPLQAFASLTNHYSESIYFLAEDSTKIKILAAGESFSDPVDFVAIPSLKPNMVFKAVDLVDLDVNEKGEIASHTKNPISWLLQKLAGGWMTLPKHHPMEQLFTQKESKT